jgi:hypothetical protein
MKRHRKLLVFLAVLPLFLGVITIVGLAGFFSGATQYCLSQGQGTYYLPSSGGPVLSVSGFNKPEQLQNIAIIRDVGVARGRSLRDIQIALMVAKQESNLFNVPYGDRDSLGLFQQRPSQGWGSAAQIMDPVYASNRFYEALEAVDNRDSMPLIEVAIAVQKPNRAAYESTFNLWEAPVLLILTGFTPGGATASGIMTPSLDCSQVTGGGAGQIAELAVQAALSQYGQPYRWDATNPFDNSGFTQWAYEMAGVSLPFGATAQYQFGTTVPRPGSGTPDEWLNVLQRGDLLYWTAPSLLSLSPSMTHVAMYLGNGQMIDTDSRLGVPTVVLASWTTTSRQFAGATRPTTAIVQSDTLSAGWRWPLDTIRITSPFGMRVHPITGVRKLHDGVDFAASLATPVKAAHSGRVVSAGPAGGYGNFVTIDHGGGVVTGYAHLSVIRVQVGQQVVAGQVIALSGNTGTSTGPHLHFNVRVSGSFVDPIPFMRQFGLVP